MAANRPERDMTRETTGRRARVPVGGPRYKLALSRMVPPDKVGHIVADEGDRIQRFLDAGYTFVEDPDMKVGQEPDNQRDPLSNKVRKTIGTSRDKRAKIGYLMVIDKDLYNEDQEAKVKAEETILNDIKHGFMDTGKHGNDGLYQKPGSVQITGIRES